VGFGQSLEDLEARGRKLRDTRALQQLFLAAAADGLGEDAGNSAQAVIGTASTLHRAAMGGSGAYYMDAEAYVILGSEALALDALQESLLGERGFVPWDSFRRLADSGLILSRLEGNPEFEAWKAKFRERRAAARAAMIEMEQFGEIPAPPDS
jgi:hypothetical protein